MLLAHHIHAQVESVEYFPKGPLALGKGVTSSFPLTEHFECIDYDRNHVRPLDTRNTLTTAMRISIVNSSKELQKIIGVSAKMAAHVAFLKKFQFAALSGDGSFKQIKDFTESSVALVISIEANYGRYELEPKNGSDELQLKPKYQALLDNGDYKTFVKMCGTHFIKRENRRGYVMAILKISNLTKEQKRSLSTSLRLSRTLNAYQVPQQQPYDQTQYSPTDGSSSPVPQGSPVSSVYQIPYNQVQNVQNGIGLGVDQFLKQAKETNGTLDIQLTTGAGGGIENQSSLFDSENIEFKDLLKALSQYMKSFKIDPSMVDAPSTNADGTVSTASGAQALPGYPAEYFLMSYELYGLPKKYLEEINNDLLEDIYYRYVSALSNQELIKTKLDELNPVSQGATFSKLSTLQMQYQNYINVLWNLAQKILAKENVDYKELPIAPNYDFKEISLGANIRKALFVCESVDGINCGTSINAWNRENKWTAYFQLKGTIGAPDELKQLSVQQINDKDEVISTLAVLNPGDDQPKASLSLDGNFSIRFGELTQQKNVKAYKELRKKLPRFQLVLTRDDGSEIKVPVPTISLEGQHMSQEQVVKVE